MAERSPGGYDPSSVIHRFQALLQRKFEIVFIVWRFLF
jgi:hypothetical protein